jgi:hypothetical protein
VVDSGNSRVTVFDAGGGYLGQWGQYGSGDGQFLGPDGIALEGSGRVYVVDTENARIQVFAFPPVPAAFGVSAGVVSALHKWSTILDLRRSGVGIATHYLQGNLTPAQVDSFTVGEDGIRRCWEAIQFSGVQDLPRDINDTSVADGIFTVLTIAADSIDVVRVRNQTSAPFERVVRLINSLVPPGDTLVYYHPSGVGPLRVQRTAGCRVVTALEHLAMRPTRSS